MASAFVDGALEDLKLFDNNCSFRYFRVSNLRLCLRNLTTFLLYARDGSSTTCGPMGPLFSRLEDSLIQNGKDFHNLCLRGKDAKCRGDLFQMANQLTNCIESLSQEIMESYNTLSDYWSRQSRYPSKEFLRSLIVNIADIRRVATFNSAQHRILIEAFEDQLVFFINFFRFTEFRGFEPCQLQVLVTRLHFVTVNAAILCFRFPFDQSTQKRVFSDELMLKFSELFLKIKPIDPRIHETCVHVLTASNVSRSSHALILETDKHVLGDFVDSLLWQIVEALSYGDSYMISLKDQMSLLHEGLRFLRTILTKHLEKIDELNKKAKDLIGAAVNDAAIVICSFPVHEWEEGLVKEIDFALHNFLERIKLIKVITSAFIFPKSNEHGFIDFLLENLKELTSSKVDSIAFVKNQLQTVQEDLVSLRSFWESIPDNRKHDGKLQSLWKRIVEVAYKTHFFILSLVVGDISNSSPLEFRTILEEINLIRLQSLKIVDNHCKSDSKAQKATNTSNPLPSQGSTPTIDKIMVILEDEENKIIQHLSGGSNKLDIISIVGMPGLGKTTLARSVYDNPSVRSHFHTSAWCVVSQAYKKKDLLLQILNSVDPSFSGHEYSQENELEEKLRKSLLRKRYLIILDDVWDIQAWSALERSFPDNANSSRILLTSRHSEVAKKINPDREPHPLRRLENKECLDLLQKKLHCIKSYPLVLMEIAKACRGLPLTIVIVAGILANSDQNSWEGIAKRLSSSALSDNNQCVDILELSFRKLPENLKSCLLYFGLFPEDEEISVRDLIWFWIAEGFIEKSEHKSLKDVAMDYMNDLISRSLVMVSKRKSMGGVKTCRIHDLLREFYVLKSKKEKFLSLLRGHDELCTFLGQGDLQRLSVHSTARDFGKSKLSCLGVRSLIFFAEGIDFDRCSISFIFHFYKLLKVLALEKINLGFTFPVEITLLVELRYLAIQGSFTSIPSAIANLSNLEILFVHAPCISLPNTTWNMLKLRVLRLHGRFHLYDLPIDMLEISFALHNLDTFSTLELSRGQSLEKIMRKLPNIRRLKCQLYKSGESNADCNGIVVMDFLSRLESLHLEIREIYGHCIVFRIPKNLKKLSLSKFPSCVIPKGRELTNLVVLKLQGICFEEDTWDMNEEWEFPNLKFLELNSIRIHRWTGIDDVDNFPLLEKLVLQECDELKEVPSCLSRSTTLQMIKVINCPKSVVRLIMQIKEDQKDNLGTEDLQVLVRESWLRKMMKSLEEDEPSEDAMEGVLSEDEMED